MECYPLEYYTVWYNVILYFCLLQKMNYRFMKTYLLFALPIFAIGEYLFWIKELWKKCNYTFVRALFTSFIGHWIPLILFYNFYGVLGYDSRAMYLVCSSLLLYICYYGKQICKFYGLN